MSYIDTWKNKMKNNGGSVTASIRKNADRIYTNAFKENDSYREATLMKSDLTEEALDVRVVNKDSSPNEKRIYLLPNTKVRVGSYIKYFEDEDEFIYIVDSVERNLESPCCYSTHCNQNIKLSKDLSIPCIAAGESYGVKIFSSDGSLMSDIDTKVKVTVQRNKITESIPLNTRFMFGTGEVGKNGIYVIGDMLTYSEGVLLFTCKKDNYMEGYDDLENGIAYNGDLELPSDDNEENTKPVEYIITGEDEIRKGQTETYSINYANENGSWEVEDYSNSVEIINQDNSSITLKALKYGDYISLSYKVNDTIATIKDIELVR